MQKSPFFMLLLVIPILLFFSGCISKIDKWDRLDSNVTFNMSDYLVAEQPLNTPTPCTCMVCTKDNPSSLSYVWYKINPFKEKLIETDLYQSKCHFVECNASIYSATLGAYDEKRGVWGKCSVTSETSGGKTVSEEKACAPRFFMIGQGASSGEFSLAQRYCSGRLTMPVIWTTYDEKDKPAGPNPSTLVCHLSKSQMPIVVYHSLDKAPDGKYMASKEYSGMVASFHNLTSDPTIEGPIMVTTEAQADPYYTDADGNKMLNITLLQNVGKQLGIIRAKCPDCLSVLALKPTFINDSSPAKNDFPDLCAIDYFLPYQSTLPASKIQADPYNCSPKYPPGSSYATRPAVLGTYADKIDIVGVAFIANNKKNMTTCSPASDVDRHLAYSEFILKNYRTPSVWYAVGMSAGPTLSEGCSFSETQIAQEYDHLIKTTAGFVQGGIIGIAPYKFLDSPSSLPLDCISMRKILTSSQDLSGLKDGDTITSNDPSDTTKALKAYKVLVSTNEGTYFRDEGGRTYLAYPLSSGAYIVNESGCQFGFRAPDGTLRRQEAYMWFSSCQYYSTNKGFVFTSGLKSIDGISKGDIISSADSRFSASVYSILSESSSEIIFLGTDNVRYAAVQDGPSQVDIYDMPSQNYTQQPIIFSSNGVQTNQCNAFESGSGSKLFYRSSTSNAMPSDAALMEPPLNADLQKQISQMQCGACMFESPMPKAFCEISASNTAFPKDACTQYPQMDDVFLLKSEDPVFMRSIAIGESGLGYSDSSACAIGAKSGSSCGRGDKSRSVILASPYLPYCSVSDLKSSLDSKGIDDSSTFACGLGVMQCIDAPGYVSDFTKDCGGSSYNPFNPYNSACCGSNAFNSAFKGARTIILQLRDANDDISGEISDSEIDWYAAWLAMDRFYLGMTVPISEIEQYSAQSDGSFVKYTISLYEKYKKNGWSPYYGTSVIIRYNNGILKCTSGCPQQTCSPT